MKYDMQRTKVQKPTLPDQPRYTVTVKVLPSEESYELNYEELVGQPYGDEHNDIKINPDNAEALLSNSLEEYGDLNALNILCSLEDWSMIPKDFAVEVLCSLEDWSMIPKDFAVEVSAERIDNVKE